jgi:predicted kinase
VSLTLYHGIGSGKSTLAKSIVAQFPSFVRFSIDTYVFEHHGAYGKDYAADMYEPYQDEAEDALRNQLKDILRAGQRDVVLDYSFWEKETRDEYRSIIEQEGQGLYHSECLATTNLDMILS